MGVRRERFAVAVVVGSLGALAAVAWWGLGRIEPVSIPRSPEPLVRNPETAAPVPVVPLPLAALAAGERRSERLPPGASRSYTLFLEAGQYLHLIVEQFGVDVVARLRSPAEELLLQVDSPTDDRGPEDLFLVVEETGTHELEISAWEGPGDGGRYEIRVEALRAATKEDRKRAAAAAAFSEARLLDRDAASPPEAVAAGYREAATIWSGLQDEGREAWALFRWGLSRCDDAARYREGAELLARSAVLFRKTGDERQEAMTLAHLGDAWWNLGEMAQAGSYYEQSLALFEKQGDLSEQAIRLNDLAILRRREGRMHAAIDFYSRAVELLERSRQWSKLATTRTNLGLLYAQLGESRMALKQYRRALALLDLRPDPEQRAVTLTKLGDVLLEAEGPGPALVHYREALRLRRQESDTRGEAVTLHSIGLAWLEAKRPQEALQAFRSVVEIFRDIEEKPSEALARSNLGRAYERLGYPGRARELYEQALALSPQERAEIALFGLARVARMEGRLDDAERFMERTLDALETVRDEVWRPDLRASYQAAQQDHYTFFIDLLAERHQREPERGHDARAFAVSERARARSLLDLLSIARQNPDPEELRRIDELSRSINAHHAKLLAASSQRIEDRGAEDVKMEALIESLRQARAEAQGPLLRKANPPILSLESVQSRLLDQDTLLLEYFLGEERSFLWAVTPETARFVTTLPGREKIEALARQVSERMLESRHQTGKIAATQAAARLSQVILGPVADLLDRRRLVIVASGALQKVPFSVLPRPDKRGEFRLLIEDHKIVSLPSASVLASLRARIERRRPATGLLAVVADPVFAPPFTQLRYAGREAEAILSLAGRQPVLAASGPAASRTLLESGRLDDYRILHFATHGLPNDLYPELSSLALSTVDASGRPVDSQFRAYEVSDLKLRADLVVLSACRTGLGKEVGNEGLVGLTQAFLHAGASRLVVSLWDVDDRATGELMKRFYTGLLAEGLPPAEALRQAQISIRREDRWSAPYYWAGFVLQGEWN